MASEKIKAWGCPHCGKYREDEETALRCCTSTFKVEIEEEQLDL